MNCEYHDCVIPDGESCPECDAHGAAQRKEFFAEYHREKGKSKLPPGATLDKVEKIDELKSGQWWLWSCDVHMPGGEMLAATVQGSDHETALETLEFD